jgi:hypothetical protein
MVHTLQTLTGSQHRAYATSNARNASTSSWRSQLLGLGKAIKQPAKWQAKWLALSELSGLALSGLSAAKWLVWRLIKCAKRASVDAK